MATVRNVLRIGSWNIHEALPAGEGEVATWDSGLARRTRDEAAQIIVRHKLDILGLQEVDFVDSTSDTLRHINLSTPLKYAASSILSESSFHADGQAGVAVLSRFPLENVREQRLRNPRLTGEIDGAPIRMFDKGYVSADVVLPRKSISAVALHTFPFHLFGRNADDPIFAGIWSDLSRDLAELAAEPLIVCGDFNSERRDLVSKAGGLSLSRSLTHEATHHGQSYDDVLFTSGFELSSVRVIDNFSDHKLCLAELVWPD